MQRLAVLVVVMFCSACRLAGPGAGDDVNGDDAPVDAPISTPTDTDGDGILDVTDNCPKAANAMQLDHDKDGRGDVCDGCPHLPDTSADLDKDGVGDACDPHPTIPGDRIALWEDFLSQPSWSPVIGANTWKVDENGLRQDKTDAVYQLVRDAQDLGTVFIDVRMRVNNIANTTARKSISVIASHQATTNFFFCALAIAQTTAEINAGKVFSDTFFDFRAGNFGTLNSEWFVMQLRAFEVSPGRTHIGCASRRGSVIGAAEYETDAELGGDIGFRTNGVDASIDYVFVVESP